MTREFSMDRRAYLKTVGAVGTTGLVAGCLGGSEEIVPGTSPSFPPFEYKNDSGEIVGFDIDLTSEIVDRTDYELGDWVDMDFGTLIGSLNNDEIDLIAAGMTINDDRDQQIDFSDPYYEANQSVLVREGGDVQPGSESDLSGLRVGAQSGTTGEDQVNGLIEDGVLSENDYRQYDDYTLAVEDLANGNVDAVVIDVPVAENFVASRDVVVAFEIETGEEFGLGMREGDDRLSDVNDALAAVKDDGTYDDLVAEYFE